MKKQRVYEDGNKPTERKVKVRVTIEVVTGTPTKGGYEPECMIGKQEVNSVLVTTTYSKLKEINSEIANIAEDCIDKVNASIDNDLMLTDWAE